MQRGNLAKAGAIAGKYKCRISGSCTSLSKRFLYLSLRSLAALPLDISIWAGRATFVLTTRDKHFSPSVRGIQGGRAANKREQRKIALDAVNIVHSLIVYPARPQNT